MDSKIMMILGGYGSAGICISRLLLQETNLDLVLAGRNSLKADQAAEQLNAECSGNRVCGKQVNASNPEDLREAFKACDAVVVCVPITSSGIGGGVVQAAFDAGINYIDLNLDEDKQQLLEDLGEAIKQSGRYFITEAGYVPGVPSMMAFLAANRLDSLRSLQIGALMRDNDSSYGSVIDLLIYAADTAYIYKDGAWRKAPRTASRTIDFGSEFGKQTCYPMELYELRCLPDDLGFEEAGFYSAGVNPLTDLVLFFWIVTGLYKFNWSLRLGAKLIVWTVRKFTKPPYTTTVSLLAGGKVNNHHEELTVTFSHKDSYVATAITTVAGLLQLLDGSIKEPGVKFMGHCVDPNRYLEDIKRLGMNVQIEQHRVE